MISLNKDCDSWIPMDAPSWTGVPSNFSSMFCSYMPWPASWITPNIPIEKSSSFQRVVKRTSLWLMPVAKGCTVLSNRPREKSYPKSVMTFEMNFRCCASVISRDKIVVSGGVPFSNWRRISMIPSRTCENTLSKISTVMFGSYWFKRTS